MNLHLAAVDDIDEEKEAKEEHDGVGRLAPDGIHIRSSSSSINIVTIGVCCHLCIGTMIHTLRLNSDGAPIRGQKDTVDKVR